jgi:hypothetical protein
LYERCVIEQAKTRKPEMNFGFSNRIRMYNFSRRRFALICFIVGVIVVRAFEGSREQPGSTLLVYVESGVPGEATAFDPAAGRDLRLYDRGGSIEECSWQLGRELRSCLETRENARRFIYEHWLSRKPGYIAIDFRCVDCMPVLHVFIEPGDSGRWRVVRVLEDRRFNPVPRPDAIDVRYRAADPDEQGREQTSRVLSFIDSSGAEIDSF